MFYESQEGAERTLREMNRQQDKSWCPHRRHTCWPGCALRHEGRVYRGRSGLFELDPPGCAEMQTRHFAARAVELLEDLTRAGGFPPASCGKCGAESKH
ncbi:MAG: hypothetical protein ABIJ95_07920 [Pseudomonadota bacterium]